MHVEERRVFIEAIATLVNVKREMAELILKPAGLPVALYRPLLQPNSFGQTLTKRQLAHELLDVLDTRPDGRAIIKRVVRIAAAWTRLDRAASPEAARETIDSARRLLAHLEKVEQSPLAGTTTRSPSETDDARDQAERKRLRLESLLAAYDGMMTADPQARGYALQDRLRRLFALDGFRVEKSFTRSLGGEQIDGAFEYNGWYYLVECRWRQKLADTQDLDGLNGKIDRTGKQTMGVFLSILGWSSHVPELLKRNQSKSILLMEGYGLRTVLAP